MKEMVIVSAARTPFGRFGGGLKDFSATDLGAMVIKEALLRANVPPELVDYVYMGQVLQGGCGQIPSRQATRKAGLPWEVPSLTLNKVCSSGIIGTSLAKMRIESGESDIVVSGGMESMSNAPYYLPNMRFGAKMMDTKAVDLMVHDGLWCAFADVHMATHGSNVAKEFGITRQEQDEWALRSQQYAVAAMEAGHLDEEIMPIEIKQKGKVTVISADESPRKDSTIESLAKLPPVFTKDGTITAGNAPGVNDGAGALVFMSKDKAQEMGIKPIATVLGYAEISQEAPYIATVPGLAANKLLKKMGMTIDQVDLIEANEAFAAVALISGKIANWPDSKVNVEGGAIAFGHPIGASGARILMHLAFALRRRGGGIGIACICSGAAQGDAVMIRVEG